MQMQMQAALHSHKKNECVLFTFFFSFFFRGAVSADAYLDSILHFASLSPQLICRRVSSPPPPAATTPTPTGSTPTILSTLTFNTGSTLGSWVGGTASRWRCRRGCCRAHPRTVKSVQRSRKGSVISALEPRSGKILWGYMHTHIHRILRTFTLDC